QGPAAGNYIKNVLKADKVYVIDDQSAYGGREEPADRRRFRRHPPHRRVEPVGLGYPYRPQRGPQ
ncbi:hypothetical protein, partial [Micromonospora sp. NPDC000018]|uniref:hypothetical protein n=1 Tax=Micromonospora sp. NPDC000018 TaxID=3154239 RepID=UPI00331C17DE